MYSIQKRFEAICEDQSLNAALTALENDKSSTGAQTAVDDPLAASLDYIRAEKTHLLEAIERVRNVFSFNRFSCCTHNLHSLP